MKIGFITCSPEKLKKYFPTLAEPHFIPIEPYFTPDDQIAIDELRNSGHDVKPIVWGEDIASLRDFNLLIIRSPWDYMDNINNKEQFINWVSALELANIPVCNPSSFMQWMLDKHYLKNLCDAGVSVIPTQYYEQGTVLPLLEIFLKKGEFIIKPCISAAGVGLFHIKNAAEAMHYQAEVDTYLKNGAYMVQDFIKEITTNGEWSLMYFGGQYSHAIHKKPGKNSILVHAERGGSLSFSQPKQEMIDFGNKVCKATYPAFKKATGKECKENHILYLRIDIVESSDGLLLVECEGVEPELFFRAQPKSELKFCEAIRKMTK